jgi:dephospho-CoA kinase
MAKIVIGIVGQIGSGKDTAIGFLKKHGFVNFSLSDQIRIQLKKQANLDFSRQEIQDLGDEMRKKHGDDYWAQQAWKEAIRSGQEKLIISSIRHPAEVTLLIKKSALRGN